MRVRASLLPLRGFYGALITH